MMVQQFLEWVHAIGMPGLFVVMALEGSSLPFPGIVMVLSFGYLFSPSYLDTAFIAAGMSLSYSLASLIPYFLGLKMERLISKRLRKGLARGQQFFNKYGMWSIALSRPFGIGNYISYIAGMSKVNVMTYLLLTFMGIYPWSFVMILLGDYFNGNYEAFKEFFVTYSPYFYGGIIIVITAIVLFYYKKFKREKLLLARAKEGGRSH
jgi:membrane protein DedA with SNARE-associated domain